MSYRIGLAILVVVGALVLAGTSADGRLPALPDGEGSGSEDTSGALAAADPAAKSDDGSGRGAEVVMSSGRSGTNQPAVKMNRRLARTINLAGDLELERDSNPMVEAPTAAEIAEIAGLGFTGVRIPIDFATWAGTEPPYRIDPLLFDRVDAIVDAAEAEGLASIIDLHHYEAINQDPDGHLERLTTMWDQIALRYRDRPVESVAFEVLNEPAQHLTTRKWNGLLGEVVTSIRRVDPERTLIVGPGRYHHVEELQGFELPDDDNLIATFHYYLPYNFTHQGASWTAGTAEYLGSSFNADGPEADVVRDHFAAAAEWAEANRVPVFVGEFGAIRLAGIDDRVAWTRTVREAAEEQGFSWAYWDWAAPNFGLRLDDQPTWDTGIVDALLG